MQWAKVDKNKKDFIIICIVCIIYSILCSGLLVWYERMLPFLNMLGVDGYIDGNNISDFLTVISIHFTTVFLTTGLMSILGSKDEMVYGEDIVSYVLQNPNGRSFRAFSSYAFLTLFWAVMAFVFRTSFLVIFACVTGVIIVAVLFFKMIKIYYGREKIRKEIKAKIKAKNFADLCQFLMQFILVIRSNLCENQNNYLVENVALLLELRRYHMHVEAEQAILNYINECISAVNKEIKDSEEISIAEVYVRVYMFCENEIKKYPKSEVLLEECKEEVVEYVLSFWKKGDTHLKHALVVNSLMYTGDFVEKVKNIEPKYNHYSSKENEFMELARKIFKRRVFFTSGKLLQDEKCKIERDYEIFYPDIELLISKDENRINNENEIPCYTGIFNSFELEWENKQGCFVRVLPKFACEFAVDDVKTVLNDFYYGYKKRSHGDYKQTYQRYYKLYEVEEEIFEDIWLEEDGWLEFFYPYDEYTYETILGLFFRGCAELIMLGIAADIVETVTKQVFDFWKTALSYKSSEEFQEFFESSFKCVVEGLVQAKAAQQFLSELSMLCRNDSKVWEKVKKKFLTVHNDEV